MHKQAGNSLRKTRKMATNRRKNNRSASAARRKKKMEATSQTGDFNEKRVDRTMLISYNRGGNEQKHKKVCGFTDYFNAKTQ